MGVNSLPKTVTQQRRDCDLNPGLSAPESSTLTTRLPSHPYKLVATAIPLRDRKTNFRLITRSHSSINQENFVKIGPVDFDIIGLTGIVKNKINK